MLRISKNLSDKKIYFRLKLLPFCFVKDNLLLTMLNIYWINMIIIIMKGCYLSTVSSVETSSNTSISNISSTDSTTSLNINTTFDGYNSSIRTTTPAMTSSITMSTSTNNSSPELTSTTTFVTTTTVLSTTKASGLNSEVRDFVVAIIALVFMVIFITSVVGFICYSLGVRSEKRKQFKKEIAAHRQRIRQFQNKEHENNKCNDKQSSSYEIEDPYSLAAGDEAVFVQEDKLRKNKHKNVRFSRTQTYNVSDGAPSSSDDIKEVDIGDNGLRYVATNRGVSHIYTLSEKAKGDKFRLIENEEGIAHNAGNNQNDKGSQPNNENKPDKTKADGDNDEANEESAYADALSEEAKVIRRNSTPVQRIDAGYVDVRKSFQVLSSRESNNKSSDRGVVRDLPDSISNDHVDNDYDDTVLVKFNSDTYDFTRDNPYDVTEHETEKRRAQINPSETSDNYDHVELVPSLPPRHNKEESDIK